jgi:hypothetical protein
MNHGNVLKIHKIVAFRIYVKNDLWLRRVTSPFSRRKHVTRSKKRVSNVKHNQVKTHFLKKTNHFKPY